MPGASVAAPVLNPRGGDISSIFDYFVISGVEEASVRASIPLSFARGASDLGFEVSCSFCCDIRPVLYLRRS